MGIDVLLICQSSPATHRSSTNLQLFWGVYSYEGGWEELCVPGLNFESKYIEVKYTHIIIWIFLPAGDCPFFEPETIQFCNTVIIQVVGEVSKHPFLGWCTPSDWANFLDGWTKRARGKPHSLGQFCRTGIDLNEKYLPKWTDGNSAEQIAVSCTAECPPRVHHDGDNAALARLAQPPLILMNKHSHIPEHPQSAQYYIQS